MSIRLSKSEAARLGIDLGKLKGGPRGMNKWEQRFAAELETCKIASGVLWYAFEPVRLRLARGAFYKPDFMVQYADLRIVFYEIKGHFREAAKVRIRVAAEIHRWARFVVVRWKDGAWDYEDVQP